MRHQPRLPALLAGSLLIFALDLLKHAAEQRDASRAIIGIIDETAHLATAVVLLDLWSGQTPRALAIATLAGAIMLDVDHIPGEFGRYWISPSKGRPYTHTALILAIPLALGVRGDGHRRALGRGAAAGLATHLFRDLATGGCRLGWPLVRRPVSLPYGAYAVALLAVALARSRGDMPVH